MYDTMSEAIGAFEADMDQHHGIFMGRWTAAEIMRKLDPIMYREEFYDWLDAQGIDMDSLEDDQDLP